MHTSITNKSQQSQLNDAELKGRVIMKMLAVPSIRLLDARDEQTFKILTAANAQMEGATRTNST